MKRRYWLFATLGIIGFYYVVCGLLSVDFPRYDDAGETLEFMNEFVQAQTLPERAALFFKAFQAHILATHRFLVFLDHTLTGAVNFRHLIFVGNLFLLGIWGLLLRVFRNEVGDSMPINEMLRSFFPVTLLLFTPIFLLINWAASSLHHSLVLLFALLSVYLLSKERPRLGSAIAAMAGGVFSLGSGVIIPVAGAAVLLVRKRKRDLLIWSLASLAAIIAFFYLHPKKIFFKDSISPLRVVQYFSAYYGCFSMGRGNFPVGVQMFIGLAGFGIILSNGRAFYQKRTFFLGAFSFLLGSAFLAALFRSKLESYTHSGLRYEWYREVYWGLIYLSLFFRHQRFRQWCVRGPFLALCLLLFCYKSYFMIGRIHKMSTRLSGVKASYVQNPEVMLPHWKQERMRRIIDKSIKRGVYAP